MIQRTDEGSWSVDKKVPLALIVSMFIMCAGQFGGFIWSQATTSARLEAVERAIVAAAPQDSRLTRVEVKVDGLQRTLDKIESLVQRRPSTSLTVPEQ